MENKWGATKGFTIVELLIVIVVIAILAAISVVAYNGIQNRSRDAATDSSLSQLKKSLELYKAEVGYYPAACGGDNTGCAISSLGSYLVPTYISALPNNSGLFQYVRGVQANNSYGIYLDYTQKTDCKTGVNVDVNWWGPGFPVC